MPIGSDNKRVVYYYDEEVGNFYYGQNHPMKPHRIRMTHSLVVNYGLFKKMEIYRPYRLEERDMTLFHADDYIHFIKSVTVENKETWGTSLEKFNIDVDCPIFDGLFRFCQISTGAKKKNCIYVHMYMYIIASVGGAYKLNHGLADIAVNWSGGLHHAKKAEASGFCYTNDIVLGILELLKYYQRVLYIDIDIHHGDGVEEAFYTTDRTKKKGAQYLKKKKKKKNFFFSSLFVFIGLLCVFLKKKNNNFFFFFFVGCTGVIVMQLGADSLAGDRLGCFNMTVRGHGECLEYIRSFNKPLLVLGGGGYTLRNVARCWAHETAICCGIELDDKIPYHEYYEYFAPDYCLSTIPTNMINVNRKGTLDKIMATVSEYLRELPHAPNVQVHERPKEMALDPSLGVCVTKELEKLRQDNDSDTKKDDRMPEFLVDKMRVPDEEFYADEKDQDEWPSDAFREKKDKVQDLVQQPPVQSQSQSQSQHLQSPLHSQQQQQQQQHHNQDVEMKNASNDVIVITTNKPEAVKEGESAASSDVPSTIATAAADNPTPVDTSAVVSCATDHAINGNATNNTSQTILNVNANNVTDANTDTAITTTTATATAVAPTVTSTSPVPEAATQAEKIDVSTVENKSSNSTGEHDVVMRKKAGKPVISPICERICHFLKNHSVIFLIFRFFFAISFTNNKTFQANLYLF
ncbi:hypothetical protein RFI_05297 [Reticulomyxa filosa]|uniref:histone deacetylase n=1 Tax=Reticulomyxa filosa TaxID=46433 RepID=X6P2N4_RETFI|nr:hypothetical protein RFI_05297 [Reticulomyxa filosa]|eukprot:ETO31822.1 hypothetical protein RFI_05297 [Reticulomyxa filosa]